MLFTKRTINVFTLSMCCYSSVPYTACLTAESNFYMVCGAQYLDNFCGVRGTCKPSSVKRSENCIHGYQWKHKIEHFYMKSIK